MVLLKQLYPFVRVSAYYFCSWDTTSYYVILHCVTVLILYNYYLITIKIIGLLYKHIILSFDSILTEQ